MTAIFMARMPEGIVAAADGAFYDQEGRLSHVASKLTLMPECDCIVTLQGPWFYHLALRDGLVGAAGFDDVLDQIVDATRNAHRRHANAYRWSRAFSMLVGGFSQARQRWETYWLNSEPWEPGGTQRAYEPWVLTPALATAWTPGYGREACAAAGLDPDRTLNEQGIGCDEAAIRIICAARHERLPIKDDEARGTCQVGGFVQLANLGIGTAWTGIVHRWPDVVGARLDRHVGSLLPDALRLPDPEAALHP